MYPNARICQSALTAGADPAAGILVDTLGDILGDTLGDTKAEDQASGGTYEGQEA